MAYENGPSFRHQKVQDVIIDWWKNLPNDRGKWAELRRCKSVNDICSASSYHDLCHDLKDKAGFKIKKEYEESEYEKLALIAGVLSHVNSIVPGEFPERIAEKKSNGEPLVSELRFKRLMSISDDNDRLLRTLIRILRIVENTVPIDSLAIGLYWWNMESTRRAWYRLYYEKMIRDDENE